MRCITSVFVGLALGASLACPKTARADLGAIVRDTQKVTTRADGVDMVWWIPTQYWVESLKDNQQLTEQAKTKFAATLDAYSIFCVVSVKFGAFGALISNDKDEVLGSCRLTVGKTTLARLTDDALSDDAQNFLRMMKPVMAGMLGKFGENMIFVAYPNENKGKKLLDPKSEGGLDFTLNGEIYHWRLPLGCFLPEKKDPETGETFPGNFEFNPFTGKRLTEK